MAASTSASAAPHTRSPLRRSATTPLVGATRAAGADTSCSAGEDDLQAGPRNDQDTEDPNANASPPAGLQAMQHALIRLSSQHHLSDYNRMKRLTATSQPMAPTSSMPSAYRQSTWSAREPPHTSPAPPFAMRGSSARPVALSHPAQAVNQYSNPLAPSGTAVVGKTKEGSILDSTKASLNPPAAPLLHRSYTEEEGQNPHLHLGISRGSISSAALSTPALSMDSMPPSPPTVDHQGEVVLSRSPGNHSNSPSALATPLDHGSPRYNESGTHVRTSPLATKTKSDEYNDHVLSERLLDAMDQSVVQTSTILLPPHVNATSAACDTARTPSNQQQRANAPDQHNQSALHQDTLRKNIFVDNRMGAPGLHHSQQGDGVTSANASSGRTQHDISVLKSSSIPMSFQRSSSASSSVGISASHSMMTHSSASSIMSRASTNLTSAHASGMSSSAAGMASSLSALTHATRRDVSADQVAYGGKDDFSHTLYHIHVNHPGLAGVKTSLTHPMNVSPLIPPELLHLYGQSILHAVPASLESTQHQQQSYTSQQSRARSPLGRLAMPDMPPGSNINNASLRPPSPTKSLSGSSALNISRPTTPAALENKDLAAEQCDEATRKPFVIQPSADIHDLTGPNASAALFSLTLPISQQLAMTSADEESKGEGAFGGSGSTPTKLGNLVLSSCPGKKVRLSDQHLSLLGIPDICRPGTGPTMDTPLVDPRSLPKAAVVQLGLNRSPICRDLEMDFKRAISQADVRCVVCCIDDDELRFLGAAWEEYEKVALKLGLEIIRLPMAEGFAPPSPEVLDAHLSHLITRYTLQGKNCLVHCRGGVGRAGLFACSWMIKLGLLGQVIDIHDPNGKSLEQEMVIVERVIAVIRKRRSAKAIETPQQVQFILQYTHWLASTGRHVTARQVLQEAGLAV